VSPRATHGPRPAKPPCPSRRRASSLFRGRNRQDHAVRLVLQWARTAHSDDHVALRIQGFALAGFQYLRMLFGANTTKPDIHILNRVESLLGYRPSPIEALRLLEKAAREAGISLRDFDTTTWESSARQLQGGGA
jgi:hypothetical protein